MMINRLCICLGILGLMIVFLLVSTHTTAYSTSSPHQSLASSPHGLNRQETPTPVVIPREPITANADWTPIVQVFDGVPMVLVPKGCFKMGSTDAQIAYAVDLIADLGAEASWFADEQPVHEICFNNAFWLDQYEVSNAQFLVFNGVAEADSNTPDPALPRTNITWHEAQAFCEMRGGQLPSEAKWEYAARGPDGLLYPWGNEFDAERTNACHDCPYVYADAPLDETWGLTAVDTYPTGMSWTGAYNLSGNVAEWTHSVYMEYPYVVDDGREGDIRPDNRVLRGGSIIDTAAYVRSSSRNHAAPDTFHSLNGFRCTRSLGNDPFEHPDPIILTPLPSATASNVWSPTVQEFDGVPMVLVPQGCFVMGSNAEQLAYAQSISQEENGEAWWGDAEQPAHEICFSDSFWLDQYEVSNAQFAQLGGIAETASTWPDADLPRTNLTWHEAKAFCEMRGGRLPTEAEWEYAARGPDALIYPWGNTFDASRVNFCDKDCGEEWGEPLASDVTDGYAATAPIASYSASTSWVGAYNMSGNVAEWTSSLYLPYPYDVADGREDPASMDKRILRGGSWLNTDYFVRSAVRSSAPPYYQEHNWGVRCVIASSATTSISHYQTATPINTLQTPSPQEATPAVSLDSLITTNADWSPVVQLFDGVPMVLVPRGCFMMGAGSSAHEICFDDPFWLDQYEVSNAQFSELNGVAERASNWADAGLPRDTLTWHEAQAFCEMRGGRLPTEAEWEYAARGPDGLLYPWGNEFVVANVNGGATSLEQPQPIGALNDDVTWVGTYAMASNIAEWTSTVYMAYPYNANDGREDANSIFDRVVRGGSWSSSLSDFESTFRNTAPPELGLMLIGVRCARAYNPA